MDLAVRFRCSGCSARIKAPPQLIGKARNCPGCGQRFVIKRKAPEDSELLFVPINQPAPSGT